MVKASAVLAFTWAAPVRRRTCRQRCGGPVLLRLLADPTDDAALTAGGAVVMDARYLAPDGTSIDEAVQKTRCRAPTEYLSQAVVITGSMNIAH